MFDCPIKGEKSGFDKVTLFSIKSTLSCKVKYKNDLSKIFSVIFYEPNTFIHMKSEEHSIYLYEKM